MREKNTDGVGKDELKKRVTEECFYCGEQASRADIDLFEKCLSRMDTMTRAAETAARESMEPATSSGRMRSA